ncbi:acylphosphatase [Anaerococcus sp. mt242]|uniref:acylphosphatase n=1 Tax=Anaerococcus sp. mt242 TaxID=2661917 RepID=UPI0019334DA7|nr:acylphosphatase [Anaerococcus sp. mt242]MBM0045810.1 acylphosphatase [Anaerococcus sp. mt242]
MKRYELLFKGRVQGVGFRYTSKILATKLDLTGNIENLYNGDVRCFIQGEEKSINKFIEELKNQKFIKIDSCKKVENKIIEDESTYKIIG